MDKRPLVGLRRLFLALNMTWLTAAFPALTPARGEQASDGLSLTVRARSDTQYNAVNNRVFSIRQSRPIGRSAIRY